MAVVDAALRSPDLDHTVVFVSPTSECRFELPVSERLIRVPVSWAESNVARVAWLAYGLSRAARTHGASHLLTLGGGGVGPVSSSTSVLIQQSLPFSPEAIATLPLRARPRILAIRRMMSFAATRAKSVVVQTETMAHAVSRDLGIDPAKIHVVRPGVPVDVLLGAASVTTHAENNGHLRLLYVGNSSAYKNLSVIEQALTTLHGAGKHAVLAATIEPDRGLGQRPGVEALGTVDRQRLIVEYRRATCLVMPSLTESVGLPLLEAMALSVPVVAADRPYARETCGSAALYFDPFAADSLTDVIARVAEDVALRRQMIADGRRRAAEFGAGDPYDRLIDVVLN
jgi:glycosyltransferase involved in cell wall biosynthesis